MDSLAGKIIASALALLSLGGLGTLTYQAAQGGAATNAAITTAMQNTTAATAQGGAEK